MQIRCQVKLIKYPIKSILDENKKEILYGNVKFKALLVIYKEVIQLKNIRGYYSKVIISTNFPTIRAVYMAVNDKMLYFFYLLIVACLTLA
jgi:hypothetical protein